MKRTKGKKSITSAAKKQTGPHHKECNERTYETYTMGGIIVEGDWPRDY
jgi:hypothetical protein